MFPILNIVMFLPTVDSSRVYGVRPADLSVDHPYLLPVVGDGHPGEQHVDHVEPVNVSLAKPGAKSEQERDGVSTEELAVI